MSDKIKNDSRKHHKEMHMGIFFIGLGLLFITRFWWPGIMFVIGAAMLGHTIRAGGDWRDNREARILIVIGLIFWVPQQFALGWMGLLPLLLIGAGLFILFDGQSLMQPQKRKNSEGD